MSIDIEQFKIKRLIKQLSSIRGVGGTSLISLILPSGENINKVNKKLTDEYGAAANIKSRVNRLSVLSAITSVQERLKFYKFIPENGLICYCGEAQLEDGKLKKINIVFEPYKPITTSLYMCDNRFHIDCLNTILTSNDKFGFIIVSGGDFLTAIVENDNKTILHTLSLELPKKHSKGGQSSVRFARLRIEAKHNYLTKISEITTNCFITNNLPNVNALIVAGPSNLKNELIEHTNFDQRLKPIINKVVDISYGMENGLNECITKCSDVMSNFKLIKERKILLEFQTHIAKDSGKYVFGINETMNALELRAIEKLILWDECSILRIVGKSGKIYYKDSSAKHRAEGDKKMSIDEDIVEETLIIDYLSEKYKDLGCELYFISDKTSEGSSFKNSFIIGGILRYSLDMTELEETLDDSLNEDDFW